MDAGDDHDRSGGDFGRWGTDADGLRVFDLDLDALAARGDSGLVLPSGGVGGVWHQVGNDRVTATANAAGAVVPYWSEAGLVRLGSGTGSAAPKAARWGPGYAQWTGSGWVRRVWAPFGDLPGWRVDVYSTGAPLDWTETWRFDPLPIVLGGLMSRYVPAPATHSALEKLMWGATFAFTTASRAVTDVVRRGLGARLALAPAGVREPGVVELAASGRASEPPTRPSPLARIPGRVFVAALDTDVHLACIEAGTAATVEASASGVRSMSLAVGVAAADAVDAAVADLAAAEVAGTAAAWRSAWSFDRMPESAWNASQLRSAQVRDTVLGCRYVPQGSAYSFVHGLQGAPRDYAFSLAALVHVDPAGARDLLRLMIAMQRPDGALEYAHTGSGYVTGALIHAAPSDLPLMLLWSMCEYVWATGDRDFLGDGPRGSGGAAAALRAWHHLRDRVGRGPHGLVRAGSGDWNDPIAAYVRSRRAFHRDGESTYNSALAATVLPRAADLLADRAPGDAAEMRDWAAALSAGVDACWTGSWFLRGWDGRGAPIGAEHLFVDANAWCLVAGIGSPARRRELVDVIGARCDDPSPIGATILDRPHAVRGGILADGWDTNGGVWAAMCAVLAWGCSRVDRERAWRMLHEQSLAAHAAAYPHVWYGIWSGPDSYNSAMGDREGETFVQPATPMTEFPVMNSNAHAGPLLALLKVMGVEAGPNGIVVDPHVPDGIGPWRLRTALVDVEGDGAEVTSRRL